MKKYHMKMDMMQAVTDTLAKECAGDYFITGDRKLLTNKRLLSNGREFASCEIFFFKVEEAYKILFHTSQRTYLYKGISAKFKNKSNAGENNHGRIHDT